MSASVRITCLVNNEIAFDTPLWGEHGLAFLIEYAGNTLLFDTAQTPEVLSHNIEKLDLSLRNISHIILSHGHYDHTGGLPWVLNQANSPVVVGSQAMFERKLSLRYSPPRYIGIPLQAAQIAAQASLVLTDKPFTVIPGLTVSGAIPALESSDPYLVVESGEQTSLDPIVDDRALILDTTRGLVVILGCCHAGLVSTLRHVRTLAQQPIIAVLGGSHLKPASDEKITRTIEILQNEFPEIENYRLNHCTGSRALAAFQRVFGERAQPFLAGESLTFL